MATEDQVRARRAENDQLRAQIEAARAQHRDDIAAADQDIRLERADREHESLEAELASLMGTQASSAVSAPPPPDTSYVTDEHPEGE